ncbi:MAG: methyl-accepting chemotaxis protein [Inhella sp.]|uniref:methyl-accepting chemotaxis protein n=1 Tax=Inhella sp. TaxID=1921806 RepID=UPI0026217935|nr:methyl-accepting chemotaxis protein [Inhella sp.]
MVLSKPQHPIGRKLALIQGLLLAVVVGISALAFITLERLAGSAERVAQRYAPQLDLISDVQMLMFRVSLEARHAMLVETDAERDETFQRIGAFREEMLAKLKTFEDNMSTAQGKANFEKIRAADTDFWRLGGEVLGKVKAGDRSAAFAQLKAELVPARDRMVQHIADQRQWQQGLVLSTVQEAQRQANRTKLVVLAVAMAGTGMACWLAWSLTRMMSGAFRRAHQVTQRIAGGHLNDEIYVRQGDEFGHLFGSIVEMQDRLLAVVSHVREIAAKIGASAELIDAANRELLQLTESHDAFVRGTADSTRHMTETVRSSAENVETANQLASEASKVAVHGGQVVSEVVQTMRGIDDASKRIGEIVNVIDGIAFQTNILALNAAVEAARAGEQGRGFAVVAGEVRNLAQRSAAAAKEVKALIQDSVGRVDSGSAMVDQAGQTMQSILESVTRVTTLMQDIAGSTREQRQGFEAVGQAVEQIGSSTTHSVAAVRRSNEAAAALREDARTLERAVAAFNLKATD